MKDYMNATERKAFINLYAQQGRILEVVQEWGSRGNLTKDEQKSLKMASSFVDRACRSIGDRMGAKQMQLVLQEAQRMLQKEGLITIPQEDFNGLAEGILLCMCNPCRNNHDRHCSIRKSFLQIGVPECTEGIRSKKGMCPYEQI